MSEFNGAGDVNRTYRDRLFCFLFGSEEHRDWTLSLYNAVNGTDYKDESQIQITTIREVMYLGMHNDVSFILADEMNLYEQQSTFNPNMPLRMLQYAGNLYEKYIRSNRLNKYGSRRIQLPVPRLVVFYNGTAEKDDETVLRLSDSFVGGAEGDIEVRVKMININCGRSRSVLDGCRPLREYSWLVDKIRLMRAEVGLEAAVDSVITDMPDDYEIKAFLVAHRAEVRGMLLTEYNEAEQMELFREEGREEGLAEGLAKGRADAMRDAAAIMAEKMGITEEEALSLLGQKDRMSR